MDGDVVVLLAGFCGGKLGEMLWCRDNESDKKHKTDEIVETFIIITKKIIYFFLDYKKYVVCRRNVVIRLFVT